MKEQRLICDRCDATATWSDDLDEWVTISPNDELTVHRRNYERIDLCPQCRFDFEEWMLTGEGDLTKSQQMYLEGMRLEK